MFIRFHTSVRRHNFHNNPRISSFFKRHSLYLVRETYLVSNEGVVSELPQLCAPKISLDYVCFFSPTEETRNDVDINLRPRQHDSIRVYAPLQGAPFAQEFWKVDKTQVWELCACLFHVADSNCAP